MKKESKDFIAGLAVWGGTMLIISLLSYKVGYNSGYDHGLIEGAETGKTMLKISMRLAEGVSQKLQAA